MKSDKVEKIPLSEAVTHLLEECRMVLPGIQALFGFQLIVVFNPSFQEKLSPNNVVLSIVLALVIVVVFSILWVLLPRNRKLQDFLS